MSPSAKPSRTPTARRGGTAGKKSSRPAAPSARLPKKIIKLPAWNWGGVSPERKLDILGIGLALSGLLTLLSLLSPQRSELTDWWITTLFQIAGLGSFVLPLALMAVGLWLVFRHVERLPLLSAERLFGVLLVYLNLLTWLHLLSGGGWQEAAAGKGGGMLGAFFKLLLTGGLGAVGAAVALVAWLLIGLILVFDLSLADLLRSSRSLFARMRRPGVSPPAGSRMPPAAPSDDGLPSDFHPLSRHPPRATRRLAPSPLLVETQAEPQVDKAGAGAAISTAIRAETPAQALAAPWGLPEIEAILDPLTPVAIRANLDQENAGIIEETLASFGAPGHVVEIHRGPTITQYGVEPDFIETRGGRTRVRVSKIASLADDLALALAASRIRIQAPVPGRSYVGIEVPNAEISRVALREVLESEAFQRLRSPLRFTLGKDVAGRPLAADLATMPHLLIAGTTGSGKSVCINAILCGFLLFNTPNDLRLVLVDPKRVELTGYNGIPHLLAPVIVDAGRVIGALQWVMREMDSRYHKFSQNGVRNIQEYNNRFSETRLPQMVVVIDELADLMMLAPDETERNITRLAQLARATGIHLILATQRPSVDVVTGQIKANFPARIAFAVASNVDSRVILDQPGAERLLGRGDMLFQAPDAAAPQRLQGAYVSDREIQRLVDYWRMAAENLSAPGQPGPAAAPVDTLPKGVPLHQAPLWEEQPAEEGDPLYKEAVDLVRREGRASITMLQRRMRIGYTRAARIIDAMEEHGVISPALPNTQVREVLDYGPAAPPPDE